VGDGAEIDGPDTCSPTITDAPPPLEEPGPWRSVVSRSARPAPRGAFGWRSWEPSRVAATALTFLALVGVLVTLNARSTTHWAVHMPSPAAFVQAAHRVIDPVRQLRPAPRTEAAADAALVRDRRSPVSGGLLMLPPSFHSQDGAYDLVIHFHGNTDLVEESFGLAGVNAVVVIMNLGVGSGPYEDRFGNPGALPEVLERTQTTMEKRGLLHPHLRRLALSGWSAGYGAVLKVLEQPALAAKVDSVILLDGIHVGYQPWNNDLIMERLAPFVRFAREAVEGRRLFVITHSDITPAGHYAGTRETTDAVLREVGVERTKGGEAPVMPFLHSIDGVIAKKKLIPMEPETTAIRSGLHVRGFAGDQPDHHIAHLVNMAVTALPDLVERWKLESGARAGTADPIGTRDRYRDREGADARWRGVGRPSYARRRL
jgi:hypothetical protein